MILIFKAFLRHELMTPPSRQAQGKRTVEGGEAEHGQPPDRSRLPRDAGTRGSQMASCSSHLPGEGLGCVMTTPAPGNVPGPKMQVTETRKQRLTGLLIRVTRKKGTWHTERVPVLSGFWGTNSGPQMCHSLLSPTSHL